MAEVAISSHLQQWALAKSLSRPERADSAASSPDIYTAESIDLPAKREERPKLDTHESLFQDRYLSSEEDLSPMEPDFDNSDFDDDDDDDVVVELVEATAVSAPIMAQRPKSGDMAVTVSYVSAGRPKIVDVPTVPGPVLKERPSRTSSLAVSPMPELANLDRMSISTVSNVSSPRASKDSNRRRSISFSKASYYLHETSTDPFPRTETQSVASLRRPSTSKSLAHYTSVARNSFHLLASKSSTNFHDATGLPSPSPSAPSFLNSDPFAEGSTNAASPTIKSGNGHKRLRSISRSLALAKIAINKPKAQTSVSTPTEIKTPLSATAPRTPMTPEPPRSASSNRRRLVPRVESMPPMPTDMRAMSPSVLFKDRPKLVPRGAGEREPMFELPPFEEQAEGNPNGKKAGGSNRMSRLKKRKSMLGLA